jgi:hypothetical protein
MAVTFVNHLQVGAGEAIIQFLFNLLLYAHRENINLDFLTIICQEQNGSRYCITKREDLLRFEHSFEIRVDDRGLQIRGEKSGFGLRPD